tara:strand:+ start:174 stop:425 length:252 start_codon:yes stop_codon:yes gene_type:complete
MKKLAVLLIIVNLFYSCEDLDSTEWWEDEPKCGYVIDDDVDGYQLLIRNSVTGNLKWWSVSSDDWINAHINTVFCITNANEGW